LARNNNREAIKRRAKVGTVGQKIESETGENENRGRREKRIQSVKDIAVQNIQSVRIFQYKLFSP
jgi:hypothetical protein